MTENSGAGDDPKDLFGQKLLPPRDRRGRRKLVFASEVYEKVEHLRAMGMSPDDIAVALNISTPTLRKYFFPELKAAAARVQAEVFDAMAKKAKEGNVAAAKFVNQQLELGRAAPPITRHPLPAAPVEAADPEEKPAKIGKKAAADLAARTAHEGNEWGGLLKH